MSANRTYQAERKLEELCATLTESTPAVGDSRPSDAAILRSLPGVGTVIPPGVCPDPSSKGC
jgi:hypothetical protein